MPTQPPVIDPIKRRPTTLGNKIVASVVYTSTDKENWSSDDKLVCRMIRTCEGIEGGEAQIDVKLSATYTAKNAKNDYLGLTKYVLVDTGEEDIEKRSVLFCGRIVRPALNIGGGQTSYRDALTLDCDHLCAELDRLWISGRRMIKNPKTDEDSDGNPDLSEDNILCVPEPTIFNFKGGPNRYDGNVERELWGQSPSDPKVECPIFTTIRDGFADIKTDKVKKWTYADVLKYLVGWYAGDKDFNYTSIQFRTFLDDLGDSKLKKYVDEPAVELNLQGLTLRKAIDKVARAAGIRYSYRPSTDYGNTSTIYYELRAWPHGSGREVYFQMQQPQSVVANGWPTQTGRELLANNNISHLQVAWDSSKIATAVAVYGSPYRFEFTSELVPGWPLDEILDHVADKDKAKTDSAKHWFMDPTQLKDDAWYKAYHADSTDAGEKLKYGRLWVLNEDGAFPKSTETVQETDTAPYNRKAFDVINDLSLATTYPSLDWAKYTAKRPRKLLPCLTNDLFARSQGIVVEASFDSGSTWTLINNGARNLEDRCGVWLAITDLSKLMPTGTTDPMRANAWWAILDKKFRIRVTASIELDYSLGANVETGGAGKIWHLHEEKKLRFWKRLAKSKYATNHENLPVIEYDNSTEAANLAKTILAGMSQYRMPGIQIIPWLETEYCIGDVVKKVEGRDIELAQSVGDTAAMPEIAQIVWRCDESWSTELCLADKRLATVV